MALGATAYSAMSAAKLMGRENRIDVAMRIIILPSYPRFPQRKRDGEAVGKYTEPLRENLETGKLDMREESRFD